MRPTWIAATAITFMLAAPCADAQESSLARMLHRAALDNGLELLVVENHTVPLATVLVAVKNGAFTQQPGEEGLPHLFEHLLFRTYGGDPSDFGEQVGGLNGAYNGTTGQEVVTYYVVVPSEHTEKAIRLLGRLLQRVRFGRRDLEEERPVVLDELSRGQADPEQALERRVDEQLWGDAWHRRDVEGDSASLEGITAARLQETFERYYVPNNAAVIVTGDVSAPEVVEATRRHFGGWERHADPFTDRREPPMAPAAGSKAAVVGSEYVQDVTVYIKMLGPGLEDDTAATYAADALFEILNEPSSAFQRDLVGSGLFQEVRGGYLTLSGAGPITLYGKTTPDAAQRALIALVSVLDQPELLLEISEEDFAIARKRRDLWSTFALEASATLAPRLADWWATGGIDYYLSYDARLNQQTLADLERFVRRYLYQQPKVIGVLGPPHVMSDIAEWLQMPAPPRP